MKLLTTAQMQDLDRRTIEEIGIPGVVLMENAGREVAQCIMSHYRDRLSKGILVLAGKGNNGGDGYVIARYLLDHGYPVKVIAIADRKAIRGDAAIHLKALENCGGTVQFYLDEKNLQSRLSDTREAGVLVDALFGTGLTKPIRGLHLFAVDWLNRQRSPVVAVDVPSGIDASTGCVLENCVDADLTVTFAFAKLGQLSYPAAEYVGKLVTVGIGIPSCFANGLDVSAYFVDSTEASGFLPNRPATGHKGSFGHLLVVAGSLGKAGAATLSAEAGLRGGAGLVTLACPEIIQSIAASKLTEVMSAPLADLRGEVSLQALDDVIGLSQGKQALAIGPGLGLGEEVAALVRRLLQDTALPTVVDADALNALVDHTEILKRRSKATTILTPHPGEMGRLTGLSTLKIQADRVNVARSFAQRHGVVLVLKGARTLTASPDGKVYVNASGHAGLSSGGMGDVLTGLIASLLAQGLAAEEAAVLGVFLHGHAADQLRYEFGDAGLLARDVLDSIPKARKTLAEES